VLFELWESCSKNGMREKKEGRSGGKRGFCICVARSVTLPPIPHPPEGWVLCASRVYQILMTAWHAGSLKSRYQAPRNIDEHLKNTAFEKRRCWHCADCGFWIRTNWWWEKSTRNTGTCNISGCGIPRCGIPVGLIDEACKIKLLYASQLLPILPELCSLKHPRSTLRSRWSPVTRQSDYLITPARQSVRS